jgi:REP element-mobilizing transposase RayT
MKFQPHQLYHVYNRGNDQKPIFYEQENYFFFLKKMRRQLCPFADIFAYCLMPNHFHWLLFAHEYSPAKSVTHPLNNRIGTLLSSYAKAINKRYDRTGSLFQQKTKAVQIDSQTYGLTCFHYIHQNPVCAGLVQNMGEWPYSSYPDYCSNRSGKLVTKHFALEMLGLSEETILEYSKKSIDPQKIKLY